MERNQIIAVFFRVNHGCLNARMGSLRHLEARNLRGLPWFEAIEKNER